MAGREGIPPRMSQMGLVARSAEGHAAMGMAIKGREDLWVEIQANTFKNWVNEHLRQVGEAVSDLACDLCDGTRLCALVEVLQKRPLRPSWLRNPANQHQYLENVSTALAAVADDGVKLVNIGNVDIVKGSLKLVLGLIWSLILRYQLGGPRRPPRGLLLAWLQAVLPECRVTNFTTDWNSGVALSALVDYCRPGLLPGWRGFDPRDSVANCRRAMEAAREHLQVPMVVSPEDLSSPFLDELSGITYLSYFMREGGPGTAATLHWLRRRLGLRVDNFTTDWNDGSTLWSLVRAVGGVIPGGDHIRTEPAYWEDNLSRGIAAGQKLGVEPVLRARDMADRNVDHLGVMAYAARYQWVPARHHAKDTWELTCDVNTTTVHSTVTCRLQSSRADAPPPDVVVQVLSPSGKPVRVDGGAFVASHVGTYQVTALQDGQHVKGSPAHVRVTPQVGSSRYPGMEPCSIGSIVEVLINSKGAPRGEIDVVASPPPPSPRRLPCKVEAKAGMYTASFTPDEGGLWSIAVTHGGEHIEGGPFTCLVCDTSAVKVRPLEGALPGQPFSFTVDASGAWGDVTREAADAGDADVCVDVVQGGRSFPHRVDHMAGGVSRVSLVPDAAGKYKIYVYVAGLEAKGSPFTLRVGGHRARDRRESPTMRKKDPPPHVKVTPPTPTVVQPTIGNLFPEDVRTSPLERRLGASPRVSPVPIYKPGNSPDTSVDTTSNVRDVRTSPLERRLGASPRASPVPIYRPGHSPDTSVDTTSNVRVSTVLGGLNQRADSWDAIAKTKSVLSYGSLESLANLAATAESTSTGFSHVQSIHNASTHHNMSSTVDTTEESHRLRGHSPSTLLYTGSRGAPVAMVTGDALRVIPVHRLSTVDICVPNGSVHPADVDVTLTGPSRRAIPIQLSHRGDHVVATFTAIEVGEHLLDVLVRDVRVMGSPFRSHAYDAKAIQVGRIPNGILGQPVEFEIDGSAAGSGNLEILVNGGHVTSRVRNLGGQRFEASFVPHEAGPHTVDMRFNGDVVSGSPWQVAVMSAPKMTVLGDTVRLVPAGTTATFELSAVGYSKEHVDVHIITPSKRPISPRLMEEEGGQLRVQFVPSEVGSHLVEVSIGGHKLVNGPLVAKVYNSGLIRVTDVGSGVVGQPCTFRVDASQAGEGQLEISINDGEVPNHVQVVGGGRCVVSFTPEHPTTHLIDIKFNGETVAGCPFVCTVSDTSRVSLNLRNLELIPVHQVARFMMGVDGSGSAELAVSVRGPAGEVPVKVSGSIHSGFTAEFTPKDVGSHSVTVDYNGHPVSGTPFVAKAYDPRGVLVGPLPTGCVGKPLQFMVDASQAGEGNLEITISCHGHNIPTQVHPQGNARFAVSFTPVEGADHVISISFNREAVPGSPFLARVQGDPPHHITVSGPSLAAAAVGKTSLFTVGNVSGNVEDLEVTVEGPNGQSVAAQVKDTGSNTFHVEFSPRTAGEHRVAVAYRKVAVAGSPFLCKVYDVKAIRVRAVARGVVGKPVTFIVETSQAGPGNLEVTVNGGRVPTSAQAQGPHTYAISFTAREPIVHTVDLRFNGEDVPGSPFSCQVSEAARVVMGADGLEKVSVNRAASFSVEADPTLGRPEVQVLSPSRRALTVDVGVQDTGRYTVNFTPTDVGDHSVEVKVAGVHVEGSPFLVKAYDASRVSVTDINGGVVGRPVFFSINASQAGAGNLEIIVSVRGRNVPNYVHSEGSARFRVNFRPREAAGHTLSVRFNGEPVPGSPFTCKVVDAHSVLVTGSALKMAPISHPVELTVDPQVGGEDPGTCEVTITSSSGQMVPVALTKTDKFTAEFTPTEVGRHSIAVVLDGETVKGSPFACNVYDVSKVRVTGLGAAKVGKPATFTVDASEAGEGTLELVVSTPQSTVKAEVVACARGLYDVTFVPHEAVQHYVNISFNEDDVPGSPFECEVVELAAKEVRHMQRMVTVKGGGRRDVVVGTPAYLDVDPKGLEGPLDMEVTGPTGSPLPCAVRRLPSGMYRAEYRPRDVGVHSVAVAMATAVRQAFQVDVFDPRRAHVLELEEAFCHRAASFKVDTVDAGRAQLTVSVHAAGLLVDHSVREVDHGRYHVTYHPQLAVPHRIHVKLNGIHITGSPLEVAVMEPAVGHEVVASGLGLHQSRPGQRTAFLIHSLGLPPGGFDVVVTSPRGGAVPVRCYQRKEGDLVAEFTAGGAGTYKIDVSQGGHNLRGSPYYCQVFDASKVKVVGVSGGVVVVGERVLLKVVRKEAGLAELDVTVTSPLGQELPLDVSPCPDDGDTDIIEMWPTVPGNYRVDVTYGGDPVPGCPLTLVAEETGVAKASGDGLRSGQVGSPATFRVAGLAGEQPEVRVDGPDSVVNPVIEGERDGEYVVTYTPTEVGVYDVSVTCAGIPVPGSPFHPRVVDPRRVRVIGGWESHMDTDGRIEMAVHTSKRINMDTSEAGPGQLTAECRGPSGDSVPTVVEPTGTMGRLRLVLTPRSGGEHLLYLQYGGFPLPRSPLLALAEGGSSAGTGGSPGGGAVRVVLTGRGLAGAKCHEEADFTIDGSQAGPGVPLVTLTGMKADPQVQLHHLGNSVYRATYTPVVPGNYLLNVLWADRQVKGCPLKVSVATVADPSRVICSGSGLRAGTVGKDIRSFIDTRRAGPGELTAHCVGPHKVAYCELYDHGDGTFTLNVKPQEAGRHALTIKYDGQHVAGSPFALRVGGSPDPSKVRVCGPGVEHGVLATFQSRFVVDTRGAGAGQLTVRIRGPKGAFRVEMQRESQKDRTILCKYDPTEPGDYRVEVKWAGELVPGSPFMVMIFDTQEELNRFLQGNHSPTSDTYGSVGYSTGYAHMTLGAAAPSWRGSQAQL